MKIIDDLLTRHVSKWYVEFDPAAEGKGDNYLVVYAAECVRAACNAGIIEGLTADEVDDLKPYRVLELSRDVIAAVNKAQEPPKKKT